MNSAWWSVGIIGAGGVMTWATMIIKLMWNFRGKWDDTNAQLAALANQVAALGNRDNAIEQRLERHLDWHDKH
jgi:hypothetical protein